jgi:dihydrofolate reductase
MGKVIVMNGLTLDGVMQSPGRPDEDPRGGFDRGGWGVPYGDETMVAALGERLAELTGGEHAWLFGRWSYEQLLTYWNTRGGPFKDPLNNTRKYVASGNPETRLEWPNSTLLHGDVPAAVADLKTIAPVVLGTGRRMFPEGVYTSLRLTDSTTTSKGVIVATYETV